MSNNRSAWKMTKDVVSEFEFDHSLVTVYIVLLLSVLLCGLLTNVLLCTSICSSHRLRRTPSDMGICAMAGIHCIASLSAVLTVDNILHTWITGEATCKMIYFILHAAHQLISCILLILHLDEYMKLKHPRFYQNCLISHHWKKVTVFTWNVIMICNSPQLFYQEVRRDTTGAMVCSYDNNSFAYKLHSLYSVTIHVLKFLITLSLNMVIRKKLYSTSKTRTSGGMAVLLGKRKRQLKAFSILFLLNFALASPLVLLDFISYEIQYSRASSSNIWLFVQFLYFSRYFCCSIVHIFMNRRCFHQAKELIQCIRT